MQIYEFCKRCAYNDETYSVCGCCCDGNRFLPKRAQIQQDAITERFEDWCKETHPNVSLKRNQYGAYDEMMVALWHHGFKAACIILG